MKNLTLTIEGNKKLYQVPDCWEDLTLRMFRELMDIDNEFVEELIDETEPSYKTFKDFYEKKNPGHLFEDRDDVVNINGQWNFKFMDRSHQNKMDIVGALIGMDEDIMMKMYQDEFEIVYDMVQFVFTELPKVNTRKSITLDDEEYFVYTFDKLTNAEYIDTKLLRKQAKDKNNFFDIYHKLLCIGLRKKDKDGNFESYTTDMLNKANKFDNLNFLYVHSVMLGFSNGKMK